MVYDIINGFRWTSWYYIKVPLADKLLNYRFSSDFINDNYMAVFLFLNFDHKSPAGIVPRWDWAAKG